MGIENIIKMAVGMALMAAATGHLREITREVQKAQIQLLKQSQASKWGSLVPRQFDHAAA